MHPWGKGRREPSLASESEDYERLLKVPAPKHTLEFEREIFHSSLPQHARQLALPPSLRLDPSS